MELGGWAQHFWIRDSLGSDASNLNNEDEPTLWAPGNTQLQEEILTQACVHSPARSRLSLPFCMHLLLAGSCARLRAAGSGRLPLSLPVHSLQPAELPQRLCLPCLLPGCHHLFFLSCIFLLRAFQPLTWAVGPSAFCSPAGSHGPEDSALGPGAWMGPGTAGTTASMRCAFHGQRGGGHSGRVSPTAQGPFGKDSVLSPISWRLHSYVRLLLNGNFYLCLQPPEFDRLEFTQQAALPWESGPLALPLDWLWVPSFPSWSRP